MVYSEGNLVLGGQYPTESEDSSLWEGIIQDPSRLGSIFKSFMDFCCLNCLKLSGKSAVSLEVNL